MADIFVEDDFYMRTSSACVIDLTPPVFSGINFLDVESRGQIRASWLSATDANNPVRYEVYIQESTSTNLFLPTNISIITSNLQADIFTMPDGSFLQNGSTYYVGVRAVDALGNRESNLVSLNVISTGVLTSIDTFDVQAAWSVDVTGQFNVSIWASKNGSLAKAPSAVLGLASYSILDKTGNLVSGMSASSLSANSDGIFIAPSVSNILNKDDHYELRVVVSVDGEDRVNILRMEEATDIIDIQGVTYITSSGQLVGSFWVDCNSSVVTTGLGTGSYQAYTASGVLIPGLSESGIVVDSNGFFSITPFSLPSNVDVTQAYVVRISVEVAGVLKEKNIVIEEDSVVYDCKASFSINALNQLQASFWVTQNNQQVSGTSLGVASYELFDKSGVLVSGISESGIVADSNGYYTTAPVSAALIADLTHYVAKITIVVAGKPRIASKGFTLLGT